MKINNNNLLRQWAMRFFFGGSSTKPLLRTKSRYIKNADTVHISWRAKQDMLNEHIEKIENSGEPLTGVSYEEYRTYYYEKHNRLSDRKMKIQYRQALKGSNASLKEKEWRTNLEYLMPTRLYSSPEVTADREAALEKYRSGEKLEEWETKLLAKFPNMGEGNRRINEAQTYRMTVNLQNRISSALSEEGIELSEDDELQFEVWGYDMTVTGMISDDKLKIINEKLLNRSQGFQILYHRSGHSDEAESGGLSLVYLQSAEKFLKEAGGGSAFDIGKDRNGNFTSLSESLSEFIKKNAVGEFGRGVSKENKYREKDIEKALYMRETFNSVILTVQNGGNVLKYFKHQPIYNNKERK